MNDLFDHCYIVSVQLRFKSRQICSKVLVYIHCADLPLCEFGGQYVLYFIVWTFEPNGLGANSLWAVIRFVIMYNLSNLPVLYFPHL